MCYAFDKDLFIHYSDLNIAGYKRVKAGQTVTLQVEPGKRGLHANDITPKVAPDSEANGVLSQAQRA